MLLQCGKGNNQSVVVVSRWNIRQTRYSHQRLLAGFETEKDSRTVIFQSNTKMANMIAPQGMNQLSHSFSLALIYNLNESSKSSFRQYRRLLQAT